MLEVRRYTDDLKDEWNAFVERSRQGTFLLDRNYMDYHRDRFHDHSIVVCDDDKLLALLPANLSDGVLWSHQGLTYGGLITDERATAENVCNVFEEINKFLAGENIHKVVYKPIPWIYHRLPSEEDLYALFKVCNASMPVRYISSVIFLDDPLKWRHDKHYGANKARNCGIEVRQDDSYMAEFWKVLESNLMSAHHVKPVHTLAEILRLKASFPKQIKLYVALLNGEVVGGSLLYVTRQVVHSQYISATSEGKHLHAIDAIFRKVLTEDFKGWRYFDFGMSNEDHGHFLNEGLISQKEGFGGRGVCYDWYSWNI